MQELLAGKFGKGKLRHRINPDEAIAIGAAILAHSPEEYSIDSGDNVSIYIRIAIEISTTSSSTKLIGV